MAEALEFDTLLLCLTAFAPLEGVTPAEHLGFSPSKHWVLLRALAVGYEYNCALGHVAFPVSYLLE